MDPKEAIAKTLSEMSADDFPDYVRLAQGILDLRTVLEEDSDVLELMILGAINYELERLSMLHPGHPRIKKQITYLKLLKSKVEQINDLLIFT